MVVGRKRGRTSQPKPIPGWAESWTENTITQAQKKGAMEW